jgi:hypothetical protein
MKGYFLYTTKLSTNMTKSPPQHKQRYYYIFWSIATLVVLTGQVFIITSNNRLSNNLEFLILEQTREKINKIAN